jgi:uncharacterized protein
MNINLKEIPPEGKTYICTQKTKELTESLKDLVGANEYQAEFSIRPLQAGTYELIGFIKTQIPEDCSRCALDFTQPIHERFSELLLPTMDQPRNSKYSKVNHVSDLNSQGPEVTEYKGHHFNAGEYIHGVIGLAVPFNPAPPVDKQGSCTLCKKSLSELKLNYTDPGFEEPQSPFTVLKNLKLN